MIGLIDEYEWIVNREMNWGPGFANAGDLLLPVETFLAGRMLRIDVPMPRRT